MKSLEQSKRYCRQQTRHYARSFYFASLALPRDKKDAAYAVYAFCRYADDVVDRATGDSEAALEQLSGDFDLMVRGGTCQWAFAPAFAWAVKTYKIQKQPFMELLEGVSRDQGPVRIRTWEELRDYCYHVASVVGLMMACIFELKEEKGRMQAIDLGIAMQLTNIARDVGEDLQMDRIYLPAEELEGFGVAEQDLRSRKVSPNFSKLMQFQIARARDYYKRAEAGIPLLADDGSQYTVWLMRHIYSGILQEIEKANYDVFSRRAATSFLRKMKLAALAWRDYRRTRS